MRRMLTMHRGVIKYLPRTGYPRCMTAIYHGACWFHLAWVKLDETKREHNWSAFGWIATEMPRAPTRLRPSPGP